MDPYHFDNGMPTGGWVCTKMCSQHLNDFLLSLPNLVMLPILVTLYRAKNVSICVEFGAVKNKINVF